MSDAPVLELSGLAGVLSESLRFERGSLLLGRSHTCEVTLADSSVSRRHAEIQLQGDKWCLRDLGSSNGLYINEVFLGKDEWRTLRDGDRIDLGSAQLICKLEGAEEPDEVSFDEADQQQVSEATLVGSLSSMVSAALDTPGDNPGGLSSLTMHGAAPMPAQHVGAASVGEIIRVIGSAADALVSTGGLASILQKVLDLVFDHLPADRAFLMQCEGVEGELVPFASRTRPGIVEEKMRISMNIARTALRSGKALLVKDTQENFMQAQSIVDLGIRSAMCAPLVHEGHVRGLIYLDRQSSDSVFTRTHLDLLSILASLSAAALHRAQLDENVAQEQRVRAQLSRYNSPEVIEHILQMKAGEDQEADGMIAEEREVSILFCDISGFTSLSENLAPRAVTEMLNEIFQGLTERIFAEQGTLDKFIGDAMMVFFGAPLDQADHAQRAVRAGLAMQHWIQGRNAKLEAAERIQIRIGINSGPTIVGDIGSRERMDYTVIGDTVNVASRLESSVAKVGEVVVGPRTRELLGEEFELEALEPILLKGRCEACPTWRVLRLVSG